MIHFRRAAILLCLLALTACNVDGGGTPPPPSSPAAAAEQPETPGPGKHRLSMDWGGKKRTFTVHAPPGYDGTTSLPLVVTMHFYPGDGDEVAVTSGMSAKADKENFLAVYPDGYAAGYNALICCGAEDDVGFIKAIVERLVTRWKADPKRVYATGISNGADMTFKLAVEAPGMFAAIAPVSGGIGGKATSASYKPTVPVSVITFIGALDQYYGPINSGLAGWQERLSCKESPAAGPALPDGITMSASKCGDGSDLAIYRLAKMGHSWPGAAEGGLSYPDAGISATDIMWEFFKAHSGK